MTGKNQRSGQSIMEVIIALAIFALFAASFVSLILGSFTALTRGGDYLTASALADEGLEAVRSIRDGAWNEFAFDQFGQSAATSTSGEWQFVGEGASETVGQFTRFLTFANVCRDANGTLTDCTSGNLDWHSRLATTSVSWVAASGVTNLVTRSTLLTNWDSHDWVQTDWSGGAGQSIWSDETRYESDDGKVDVGAAGELKLLTQPLFWSPAASPVTQQLNTVHCRSSTDCWAMGNPITTGPAALRGELILHWDGANWLRTGPLAAVPNVNLNSVFCLAGSECWAVGNVSSGELILRNVSGTTWSRYPASGSIPNVNLNSVFCLAANDCWAVGVASGGELTIHWDGASWSRIGPSASAPDVALNSVFCLASNDCFAAGESGSIIRWNGASWNLSANTGAGTWNDVFMLSATDGFVAGSGGVIRRWDGVNWNTAYSTGGQTWNEVEMISASDGLVVGSGGESRRFNGVNWNTVAISNTTQIFNSLVLLSPRTGWAVGGGGVIRALGGGGYETSGSLISSAFDMSDPSPVQVIEWDEQTPVCSPVCSIVFQIKTAASQAALAAAPWSPNFTIASGALIDPSYNGRQWVQYRVELAGDGMNTPTLEEVRLNYK